MKWSLKKMSYKKLNLISPINLPIIGVKLINGDIGKIECSYNKTTKHQDWIVPLNILTEDGCYIFVDESNKEWVESPDDMAWRSIIG